MTAPTFVNSAVSTSGGTSLTASVPASVSNGDLLLLSISGGYGSASAVTGWTLLGTAGDSGTGIALYARLASSEPASYVVGIPGSEARAVMHAWRPASGSWASVGEAIMGYRGHNLLAPNADKPDSLYFQNCDYVVIGFAGRSGGYTLFEPTGWTSRGGSNGGGGGSNSIISASKTFTATTAFDGPAQNSWRYDASPEEVHAWTVVLRAPGQETLALKSFYLGHYDSSQAAGSVSSLALSLPTLYDAGDLLVTVQAYKRTNDTTEVTFGTPAGWTKKGSDQIYVASPIPTYNVLGIGVIYKVADGGDSCTITTSLSCNILQGFTLAFSTGPGGPAPTLPGTMGQANDTSSDSTIAYPAMTLDDYADDNILFVAHALHQGNIGQSAPPTGWDRIMRRELATAGDQNASLNTKMNSIGNPPSVDGTLNAAAVGPVVQFDVAVAAPLEGIDFVCTPLDGFAALTVECTDLSPNNPTSWLWEFGDGLTSTQQHPTHTYTSQGLYTVTLTVNDEDNVPVEEEEDTIIEDWARVETTGVMGEAPIGLTWNLSGTGEETLEVDGTDLVWAAAAGSTQMLAAYLENPIAGTAPWATADEFTLRFRFKTDHVYASSGSIYSFIGFELYRDDTDKVAGFGAQINNFGTDGLFELETTNETLSDVLKDDWIEDEWYTVLMQVEPGVGARMKLWADSETEPGTWDVDTADAGMASLENDAASQLYVLVQNRNGASTLINQYWIGDISVVAVQAPPPPGDTPAFEGWTGTTINPLLEPVFVVGDAGFGLDSDFLGTMDQVSIAGGVLTITALETTTPSGRPYATACIGTKGTFAQLYGTWEARIKYGDGQGVWPAFWMLEDDSHTTPPEVDILEAYPGDPGAIGGPNFISTALHYGGAGPHYLVHDTGGNNTTGFHDYKMVWTAGRMDFYFDDNLYFTITDDVPSVAMYPILNLAMGATGYRTDGTTPSTVLMEIEYLRIWAP